MIKPRCLCWLALACLPLLLPAGAVALAPPVPSERLLTQRYQLTGDSEAELLKEAKVRAIRSAVGRVYFTDYMIRGQRLLDPYISQYFDKFIARQRIWKSEIEGGRRQVDIEVVVDCEKLYNDLHEKRFFYRPALRPQFYVFMAETFDGQDVAERTGRKHLLEVINKREYRYLWEDRPGRANDPDITAADKTEKILTVVSPFQDPTVDPKTLAAVTREAQRSEVEVFVAGVIRTETVQKDRIYFDEYTYVRTYCALQLIRSDNGEVLGSVYTTVSAAAQDPETARRTATLDALNKLTPELFAAYDEKWDKMILRKADLRIMTVGPEGNHADVVRHIVARVAPDAEIYERAAYANIHVLTVSWSGTHAVDLLYLLRKTEFPKFHMVFVEPDGLILELL
ncbi:hypothetical protein HQ520_18050 [bacterium]|nr:hypothetical protein [bacterium]